MAELLQGHPADDVLRAQQGVVEAALVLQRLGLGGRAFEPHPVETAALRIEPLREVRAVGVVATFQQLAVRWQRPERIHFDRRREAKARGADDQVLVRGAAQLE